MTNPQGPESYMGKTAVDTSGDKIGTVQQVYVNDTSGLPDWVTLKTGMFGKDRFAPLYGTSLDEDNLVLPYGQDVVKDSPEVSDTDHLDKDESDALYAYYQKYLGQGGHDETGTDTEHHEDRTQAAVATGNAVTGDVATGNAVSGDVATGNAVTGDMATGNADGTLTRSEEQLRVGTQRVEAGRAGIRKYVVTEQQTVNVPVSHDEVRVVREPLQPGDSTDGATIGEDSIDVALMEDQVVVDKDVVGVEKVRLATETVTEQQAVSDSVRKEQIEVTGDALDRDTNPTN